MGITIDKGESKKIDVNANGDLTSDEIHIYITKLTTTIDKYASIALTGYNSLGTISYDSGTDETTIRLNIQGEATANYDGPTLNLVLWVKTTDGDFPNGFIRMTRKEDEFEVQEVI